MLSYIGVCISFYNQFLKIYFNYLILKLSLQMWGLKVSSAVLSIFVRNREEKTRERVEKFPQSWSISAAWSLGSTDLRVASLGQESTRLSKIKPKEWTEGKMHTAFHSTSCCRCSQLSRHASPEFMGVEKHHH